MVAVASWLCVAGFRRVCLCRDSLARRESDPAGELRYWGDADGGTEDHERDFTRMSAHVPVRVRRTSPSCPAVCNTIDRVADIATTTSCRCPSRLRRKRFQHAGEPFMRHGVGSCGRELRLVARRMSTRPADVIIAELCVAHRALAHIVVLHFASVASNAPRRATPRLRSCDERGRLSTARECLPPVHVEGPVSSPAIRAPGRQRRRCRAPRRPRGPRAAASRRS
jgi:hypothetical protein